MAVGTKLVDPLATANVVSHVGPFSVAEVHGRPSTYRVYNGRRLLGGSFPDLHAALSHAASLLHTPAALEGITNHRLAKCIERRDEAAITAVGHVYELAEHGGERWSEIVERLGTDHPVIVAERDASELAAAARQEARRRLGPVQDVCFVAYLRTNKSKRSA